MNVKRLEVPGSNIQSTPLLWPLLIMLSSALICGHRQ